MRVPLLYRDALGELVGELETDGRQLVLMLGETRFEGTTLDNFDAVGPVSERFRLDDGWLTNCALRFTLPLTVLLHGDPYEASLQFDVDLDLAPRRQPNRSVAIDLELVVGDRRLKVACDDVESGLVKLQTLAPELHFKTCYGCGLSDYSPGGQDLFGTLMCFRDANDDYRRVQTKWDLFALSPRVTEAVQETHVCAEWERRKPGTGYRG